jgi:hypothetical protein
MFKRNTVNTGTEDKKHCYLLCLGYYFTCGSGLVTRGKLIYVPMRLGLEVSECVFCKSVFRMD